MSREDRVGMQWGDDETWVEVVASDGCRVATYRCDDVGEARVLADYLAGLVNGVNGDDELEALLANGADG